jgi:hypothetical protein
MEIAACNHIFTVTPDFEVYCKCNCIDYDNEDDPNFGYFNVFDVYNAKETTLEDIDFQNTMSFESLDDLTSEADSPSNINMIYYVPEIIAKRCPYCSMVFNKKLLEDDLLNMHDDENEYIDQIYYLLDNIPKSWDKLKKYHVPPPLNIKMLNKKSNMQKTCSWGSLCSN